MTKKTVFKITIFLIILLFFTRILDQFLVKNIGRWELKYIMNNEKFGEYARGKEVYIKHLGLNNYSGATKILNNLGKTRTEQIIMVNYFDLIHPSVFLALNKADKTLIFLPWDGVYLEKGLNEIFFYKFDLVKIKNSTTSYKFIEVVGSCLPQFLRPGHTFFTYFYDSKYLNKILLFYFFYPLLIIIIARIYFSEKMYIALWYYFIMLVLFQVHFFLSPLILWSKIFGRFEDEAGLILMVLFIIHIIIYYYFFKMINHARELIKEKGLSYYEKLVVWYILLLPIIFRF